MRYLHEYVTLELESAKCRGCRRCLQACPHGVFGFSGGKAFIADKRACMECGACSKNCAFGAIKSKSGVGCAYAIIYGMIRRSEPSCGGSDGDGACGCSGGKKAGGDKVSIGRCC